MEPARFPAILSALILALLCQGSAVSVAEESVISDETTGQGSFQAKDWNLVLTGGAMMEHKKYVLIQYGSAAIEHFFYDNISGLVEFVAYGVDQDPNGTTNGLGLNLLANVHLYKTRRLACFIAGGLGVANFGKRVPAPDGTHFNFTIHGSLGVRLRLADGMHFLAAAKYMHLSNANLEGPDRNPSFDGFGGYGGLTVRF
jgi:hypothetical protein